MRQTREVAAQEISARLAAAAEKKEVVIQTRKSKLEEHIKVVDARKDGAHDFRCVRSAVIMAELQEFGIINMFYFFGTKQIGHDTRRH